MAGRQALRVEVERSRGCRDGTVDHAQHWDFGIAQLSSISRINLKGFGNALGWNAVVICPSRSSWCRCTKQSLCWTRRPPRSPPR